MHLMANSELYFNDETQVSSFCDDDDNFNFENDFFFDYENL